MKISTDVMHDMTISETIAKHDELRKRGLVITAKVTVYCTLDEVLNEMQYGLGLEHAIENILIDSIPPIAFSDIVLAFDEGG